MTRGDSGLIPVKLNVDINTITKVEFSLNDIVKTYPTEVLYNAHSGCFLFPLTQEESLALPVGIAKWQARIKYNSGDTKGTPIVRQSVDKILSEEVL